MVSRNIYSPKMDVVGVSEPSVEFEWFPGFSLAQKQRSIASLHERAQLLGFDPVLEISSKGLDPAGNSASAFALTFKTVKTHQTISVESAFQGSKVFEESGPFHEAYSYPAREAKKYVRSRSKGKLIRFDFFGRSFPAEPLTFFYDWLYINTLNQNNDIAQALLKFSAFSDIEFNPQKSINCQAYSAALFVSLATHERLSKALESPDSFLSEVEIAYAARPRPKMLSTLI